MTYKRRTAEERQAYHFEQSKKGSTYENKFGEKKKNSDFQRGIHLGKAQMIQKKRMNYAKKVHSKKQKELEATFLGTSDSQKKKKRA